MERNYRSDKTMIPGLLLFLVKDLPPVALLLVLFAAGLGQKIPFLGIFFSRGSNFQSVTHLCVQACVQTPQSKQIIGGRK